MELGNPDAILNRHLEQMIPYGNLGTTWMGYDDTVSLENKVLHNVLHQTRIRVKCSWPKKKSS